MCLIGSVIVSRAAAIIICVGIAAAVILLITLFKARINIYIQTIGVTRLTLHCTCLGFKFL